MQRHSLMVVGFETIASELYPDKCHGVLLRKFQKYDVFFNEKKFS
jgi:hypothetical protein